MRVPATFFVLGWRVLRFPGLVRELRDQGFELGSHTFSHVRLAELNRRELALELVLAESAVAGATGVLPRLLRPPYSGVSPPQDPAEITNLEGIARRGYIVLLPDVDTLDWSRPGVDAIAEAAIPPGADGGCVLLHDGGGDRSQTLEALRRIVADLRDRGYRLVPASELAGIDRDAAMPRSPPWQRALGRLLIATAAARQRAELLWARKHRRGPT